MKGKFTFRSPKPVAGRADGQRPAVGAAAGARAGHGPAAVPSRRHLRRAGQGGAGPRAGTSTQKRALVATLAGARPPARPWTRPTRRSWRRPSATRRTSAATSRTGTQAEVDSAADALAEQIASSFAEFQGVARGNPALHAGAAISIDKVGAPFDGKYTITTSRHNYDPSSGYTTTFAVTGRQERSLLGLTSGGGGGGAGRRTRGSWSGRSATPRTRRTAAGSG